MDLLGNYGSDADSDDEHQPENAGQAVPITPNTSVETIAKPSESAGIRRAGLFAALPPPKGKDDGGAGGNVSSGSLFAALPPPKAPAGFQDITDLQTDLGLPTKSVSLPLPKRGVVQFRPPIDTSYLSRNDSDDDDAWVPPKKKERKTDASADGASEKKPAKPSFASFLPPPKNSLGAGNVLGGGAAGGRKMVMETAAGLDVTEERPRVDSAEGATPSASGVFVNGGAVQVGLQYPPGRNNGVEHPTAFTNAPSANTPSVSGYRETGPGSGYAQSGPAPGFQPGYHSETPSTSAYADAQNLAAGGATWQPDATWQSDVVPGGSHMAPPVDLLTAKLMEEEARKRKRGGGRGGVNGPQIVEVKQADIAGGSYRREDMLKNNAAAFGPQMAPVSSAKDAGPGKMERRKHQISSLYADMKKKEMEMMDSRASGLQNKTQTKGKYGW